MSNQIHDQESEDNPIKSVSDFEEETREFYHKASSAFQYDAEKDYLTVNISYPYHVPLGSINSTGDLLKWVLHLSRKNWMDPGYLHVFAQRVCDIKGWEL